MSSPSRSSSLGLGSLANGLERLDLEKLELRTARIESFFNGHLLPFAALNAMAIGALVTRDASPETYGRFAPWLFLPAVVLFVLATRRQPGKPRSWVSTAGPFLCAIFAAAGLPFMPVGAWTVGALFVTLGVAVWRGWISPLAASLPCLYLPAITHTFARDSEPAHFVLFGIAFTSVFAAVVRRHGIGRALLLLLTLVVFLVVEYNHLENGLALAICGGMFFVGAFVIYEFRSHWGQHSDLRRFLAQGLVVVALSVLLFASDVSSDAWPYAMTVLLAIYHTCVSKFFREERPAPRLLWLAIWLVLSFWTTYGEAGVSVHGAFWYANLASWTLLLAAHRVMSALGSQFGLNGIRLVALGVLSGILVSISGLLSSIQSGELAADRIGIPEHLIAVTLAYAATTSLSRNAKSLRRAPAYWRGFLMARHAAILRRLARNAEKHVKAIPIVGNLVAVVTAILTSWRYLKGKNGAVSFADLTGLAAFTFGALATTDLLHAQFVADALSAGGDQEPVIPWDRLALIIAWSCWGVIIYLRGYYADNLFYRLAASVFVLIPLLTTFEAAVTPGALEQGTLMIAAALPLLLFGLMRQGPAKPHPSATAASQPPSALSPSAQ